nr:hypothetical protein [Tanacetum cinerariifolium]
IKLATKRSLQQNHIYQASGSGTDEGTCIIQGVLDVPIDESDEEISWKSSDEDDDDDDVDDQSEADDDQDDEDEQDDDDQDDNDDDQDSDNDDDDFVHPKLSTHDEEAKDEESFDPIVQTPVDAPVSTTVVPLLVTAPALPPPSIPIMSQVQQASAPTPTTDPSSFL